MKVAIISGSHRNNSRSFQAAEWANRHLDNVNCEGDIFDLAKIDMPFWSEAFWNKDSEPSKWWKPYSDRLKSCDAIILISPEWAGMVPPKVTNFLLLCSGQELAYKPTLLIGVSAGMSGTYPIASMRLSASKNNQMMFMPDHIIIRNAKNFFEPTESAIKESHLDPEGHLNQRLRYDLDVLSKMATSLKAMRGQLDIQKFPYGL